MDWLIRAYFIAIGVVLLTFLICASLVQYGVVDTAGIRAWGQAFFITVVLPVSLVLVAALLEFFVGWRGRGLTHGEYKYVLWATIGGTDDGAEDHPLKGLRPIEDIREDEKVFDVDLGVDWSLQTFAIVGVELVVAALAIDLAPLVGTAAAGTPAVLPPVLIIAHILMLIAVYVLLVRRNRPSPRDKKTRNFRCALAIALGFISAVTAFLSQVPGG